MDGKTKAIVAHLTIIGWIIALILNNQEEKDPLASFYIRQMLGLILIAVVGSFVFWIPIIGWILWLAVVVLWIVSLIGAAQGREQLVPVVGEMFQKWFHSL